MLDDLNSRPDAGNLQGEESWVPGAERFTGDREAARAKAQAAIHRWLDGEGSEEEALRADARHTELWRRVNGEVARRRAASPSSDLESRIMRSIPTGVPVVQATAAPAPAAVRTPAAEEGLNVSTGTALVVGAALVALGALLGMLL